MSGFSHDFDKYIYLPSGLYGWLKPITSEIIFLYYDYDSSNTYFEYILQVIKKYFKASIDVLDMYLYDLYYLWSVIISIYINKSDEYFLSDECICKTKNKVIVNFSNLQTNIYDKYKTIKQNYIIYTNDNYKIKFDIRKVKNNLDYIYLAITDKTSYRRQLYYIITQTKEILLEDKLLKENEYFDFYNSLYLKDILNIFKFVMKYNNIPFLKFSPVLWVCCSLS